MKRSLGIALGALLGCTGCFSLFNSPDESRLDAAAFDGAVPPDADAGPAIDGDAGPICAEREVCDDPDGVDEDCDGQSNCSDWACSSSAQCCGRGGTVSTTEWAADLGSWVVMDGMSSPPAEQDGELTNFFTGRSIVERSGSDVRCTPLSAGADVAFTLTPIGGSCTEAECFAAVALTGSTAVRRGARVAPDLVVTLYGDGRLDLTLEGRTVATRTLGVMPASLLISVGPGLEDGRQALVAQVFLDGDPMLDEPTPFMPADLLDTSNFCAENPGLRLVVEGEGNQVTVGTLTVTQRQCVNPGQFTRGDATLSHSFLGFSPWADPWMSAPALVTTGGPEPENTRYDVWVEGTDVDQFSEFLNTIGFGVLHAYLEAAPSWSDSASWTTGMASEQPKIGACHISCVPGTPTDVAGCSCDTLVNYREPTVLPVPASGALTQFTVGLAIQTTPEADDLPGGYFSIGIGAAFPAPSSRSPIFTAAQQIDPDDVDGCKSLRSPSLVPAHGAMSEAGFWLFFTCDKRPDPPQIYGIRLNSMFESVGAAVAVLTPAIVGPVGQGGVEAPEVLIEHRRADSSEAVIRMWFLARSSTGADSTVGMAQLQVPDGVMSAADLPAFQPFPANPVLDASSFERHCGGADCDILGLAVTRRVDTADTLRFLVARRVNGTDLGLVPLEQFWKDPWDGISDM